MLSKLDFSYRSHKDTIYTYSITTDAANLFSTIGTKRYIPKDSTYFQVDVNTRGEVVRLLTHIAGQHRRSVKYLMD